MAQKKPAASSPQVEEYLCDLAAPAQELCRELRAKVLAAAPQAIEEFKWSRPIYRLQRPFCYFQATKKHVTFGFHEGAQLEDPSGLLEGTGKSLRHVKLDLADPKIPRQVIALLKGAIAADAEER